MTMQGMLSSMFEKPEEGFDTFATDNVTPLVAYLASPDSERISGHVLVIWGKEVTVVGRPNLDTVFESDSGWTLEGLRETLGKHFADLEPVRDGFAVPAM